MLSIYTHGKTRVGTRPRSKRIECAELHEHPFDRTVAERRRSHSREARLASMSRLGRRTLNAGGGAVHRR